MSLRVYDVGCEPRDGRVFLRGHAAFYLEGKLTV